MNQKNFNQSNREVSSLIRGVQKKVTAKRRKVIYGIYDSATQPFWVRIDDFLVNHSRVPLEEKAYFFHLLAVMIDAGIPLVQSLQILANRTKSERFRRILDTIVFSVAQGKKFSESMARFPDVFGDMEVGVVRSGEAAGNLDRMLFRLSDQLDKSHELQVKLITASVYPLVVLLTSIVVAVGMLVWVIPGLTGLLKEGGLEESEFPPTTKALLAISFVLQNYWWAIIAGAVILYALFKIYKQSDNGRYKWDLFRLRVPVVGTLIRKVLVLRFVSMMGILFEAGLPVIQSLQIIATSLNSELYRLKTWEVIAKVQQGQKISESLADAPFLFPETVSQMIGVAERSASVGLISEKIALHYDREIDNALKRLTSLFEPLMIILVGITVAVLALAILTPIFQLSSLV